MNTFNRYVVSMPETNNNKLIRFGFRFDMKSTHTKRTMMLKELRTLFDAVRETDTSKEEYCRIVVFENCLGKQTQNNRKYSASYLQDLYGLNPSLVLFRALRYFWTRDPDGIPLLAILCAYTRDGLLRASFPYIIGLTEGSQPNKSDLESIIDAYFPNRFSDTMIKSLVRNLLSTWTQSGHLAGRVRKVRSRAVPTPGSVSYALLLGYLMGVRGKALFETEYAKLLDCSFERAAELAENASRRGWIVLKRVEDVIEVLFPNLINAQEMEWIREQN